MGKWKIPKGQRLLFNGWWPTDHFKRVGKKGVALCKKVLEEKRPKDDQ